MRIRLILPSLFIILITAIAFTACESEDIQSSQSNEVLTTVPFSDEFTTLDSIPSIVTYDSIRGFLIDGVPADSFDIKSFLAQKSSPKQMISIDPVRVGTSYYVHFNYQEFDVAYGTTDITKVPEFSDGIHISVSYYLPGQVTDKIRYRGYNDSGSAPYMTVSATYSMLIDGKTKQYSNGFMAVITSSYVLIY